MSKSGSSIHTGRPQPIGTGMRRWRRRGTERMRRAIAATPCPGSNPFGVSSTRTAPTCIGADPTSVARDVRSSGDARSSRVAGARNEFACERASSVTGRTDSRPREGRGGVGAHWDRRQTFTGRNTSRTLPADRARRAHPLACLAGRRRRHPLGARARSSGPQRQRSAGGTWPRTCSTWAPQPAQPGRPHFEQLVCLHIPPRVSHPSPRRAGAPGETGLQTRTGTLAGARVPVGDRPGAVPISPPISSRSPRAPRALRPGVTGAPPPPPRRRSQSWR